MAELPAFFKNTRSETLQKRSNVGKESQASVPLDLRCSMWALHCKKELAVFPSPAGMSLIKLFLGGNNLVFSRPERVWSVTSRLGTGKRLTLFYSVGSIQCIKVALDVLSGKKTVTKNETSWVKVRVHIECYSFDTWALCSETNTSLIFIQNKVLPLLHEYRIE